MTTKQTLNVAQLDLDVQNPRTKAEDNQTEALRSLLSVERDGEKVWELAHDICEAGMLDPGDRLYVIASETDDDRYVVLDGNRRLAALRLLSQPGLVDRDDIGLSQSMRNRFKRLQADFPNRWPLDIDAVIFDDRDAAKHFIRLRHTGENLGAGRSAWSALQIARFDNTGLWQCMQKLREARVLDLDVLNELDRSSFNITNFERVASTAEFQRRFGIDLSRSSFGTRSDEPRALKALSKLATDVVRGRVHSRGEFAETHTMTPYFDEVEAAIGPAHNASSAGISPSTTNGNTPNPGAKAASGGVPPTKSTSTTRPATPISIATQPTANGTTGQTQMSAVRKPRVSKYLVDKKDLLTVTNAKCRVIVDELKQWVSVNDAPYACALLLRSLQEITAEIYVTTVMTQKSSNNAANIDAAAKHLLSAQYPVDPADRIELAKSFQQFGQTYDQLSAAAHSTFTAISSAHVRATWTNLRGGMDLLWRRIHSKELVRTSELTKAE